MEFPSSGLCDRAPDGFALESAPIRVLSLPVAAAVPARSPRCPGPQPGHSVGCAPLRSVGRGVQPSAPAVVVALAPCAACSLMHVRSPCCVLLFSLVRSARLAVCRTCTREENGKPETRNRRFKTDQCPPRLPVFGFLFPVSCFSFPHFLDRTACWFHDNYRRVVTHSSSTQLARATKRVRCDGAMHPVPRVSRRRPAILCLRRWAAVA